MFVVEHGTLHNRIASVYNTPAPTITAALVPFRDQLVRISKGHDREIKPDVERIIAQIEKMIPGSYTKACPFQESLYIPYSGMTIMVRVWNDNDAVKREKVDKPRKGLTVQKPRKPKTIRATE